MRRTEKEFDFPGYHFSPGGFSAAERTMEKFPAGAVRLYEQEQEEPFGSPLLALYVKRSLSFTAVSAFRDAAQRPPRSRFPITSRRAAKSFKQYLPIKTNPGLTSLYTDYILRRPGKLCCRIQDKYSGLLRLESIFQYQPLANVEWPAR